MKTVFAKSFARAGFLGNPSDGYYGKTVAFSFREYCVELNLTESARLRFVPGEVDDASFDDPSDLVRNLKLYGYYGGIRMLKAVAKLFFEYCDENSIKLPDVNFTAEYKINIPRLVGLSGSSAICSAMLKALMRFYSVDIPLELTPTICLRAERDELGIACGLQDRVVQMYNGLVFMDFERTHLEEKSFGRYEVLGSTVPNLYIAFDPNRAEESGKAHKAVRKLFLGENSDVKSVMGELADIAQKGRDAITAGKFSLLGELVNANFDLRSSIFEISEENRRMVSVARSCGASAKFAGSGGAIVGIYEDEDQYSRLSSDLAGIGCRIFKPTIAGQKDEFTEQESGGWRNS